MKIAIVGATGLVGQKMLEVLSRSELKPSELYLFASRKSAGKTIMFKGKRFRIEELNEENIKSKKIDYALFSAGGAVSKKFAPIFVEVGAIVIDNSSCFRMDESVPLVVPEINFDAIKVENKIIANPNCSTAIALMALAPLHRKFKIKRIVASTYQAVSGAGLAGIFDLNNNTSNKFKHKITNNCLPHIDDFLENGYTKEEEKLINETKKILGDESILVTATAVRVPILNSHSISINVELFGGDLKSDFGGSCEKLSEKINGDLDGKLKNKISENGEKIENGIGENFINFGVQNGGQISVFDDFENKKMDNMPLNSPYLNDMVNGMGESKSENGENVAEFYEQNKTENGEKLGDFNGQFDGKNGKKEIEIDEIFECLKGQKGLVVLDDVNKNVYPMPAFASGEDNVFVGRIRKDFTKKNTFNLWVSGDNLLRGAALNAVLIMEEIEKRKQK